MTENPAGAQPEGTEGTEGTMGGAATAEATAITAEAATAEGATPAEAAATATISLTITPADTAVALGSGDLPVLATPRLLALAEEATVRAVAAKLAPGQTTVGTRVRLDHLRATPVGATVTATATLVYEDGRLLRFSVAAHDADDRLIGEGEVTRVVVDAQRFLARL